MNIHVVTLFPDIARTYLSSSIMKKAESSQAVSFSVIDLRAFGLGKYKQVDDAPYGGGTGMVLRPEPVFAAVDSVLATQAEKPVIVVTSPRGEPFDQAKAESLSQAASLLFICGHYEGMDERISEGLADVEISIGDYVLTGGELPALVVIDAVVRLLPGVLPESATRDESFSKTGMLEYPHYTRPAEFKGMKVPPVLLEGDHRKIEAWRREKALERTVSRSRRSRLS